MCVSTPQDEGNLTFEVRDTEVSYIQTKNTNQKGTTKQSRSDKPGGQRERADPRLATTGDAVASRASLRQFAKSTPSAAAPSKLTSDEENSQKGKLSHSAQLTVSTGQNKAQLGLNKSNIGEDKSSAQVDFAVRPRSFSSCQGTRTKTIVNKKWQELVPLLDSTGIPINKTVSDLLKLYPSEKVESAVALLKARKRDKHIPNLSGYFVAALKGDWGGKTSPHCQSDRHSKSKEIDRASIFKHW